jgi:hypothetical protein
MIGYIQSRSVLLNVVGIKAWILECISQSRRYGAVIEQINENDL